MEKKPTIFCDIDGTLFKYRQYDDITKTPAEVIESTAKYIKEQHAFGSYIVFTTARSEKLREYTAYELVKNEIPYHQIVMGINRGLRVLINDNDLVGGDRAMAISLKRDEGFNF